MAMQLKTGADLNNMPLSRFVIENLIADPTNNIKAGSKYFNTGTGTLANRERIYAGGKWRSTAYMDDIDALQKQLDELDFAGSEEFQSLSGRVLTIEGLFNNGKAKDAEKLGGQLPSYYAEAEIVEQLREDFDNLYKTLNDDTTGVINTWQEVVDFINEYSGSEDLSTILAAMNADIAKRALQSEVDAAFSTVNGNVSSIGTRVGSLETLTGNHTNQIADRYTKAESDTLLNAKADWSIDIPEDSFKAIGYGSDEQGWMYKGPALAFGANATYYAQLQIAHNADFIIVRRHTNQGFQPWVTLLHSGNYSDRITTLNNQLSVPSIEIGGIVLDVVDGNLRISGNAYATGELGSGQVAEEGGGSTGGGYTAFDDSVTWADYDDSMADWLLTAYHGKLFNDRIATLENKATKVEVSNLLTSGTKIATIKVDANSYDILAPSTYAWSAITNKPTTIAGYGITDAIKYNPAGIDISGDAMPLNEIGYGYQSKGWIGSGVAFSIGLSQNYWMNLQYNAAYQGLTHRVCVNGTINDWANILDEKNYKYFLDTVYLKQSGGTINGALAVSSEWPAIIFLQNGVRGEGIGSHRGKLVCYNTAGTGGYEILHLNNYADYAAKTNGSNASGTWVIDITGNAKALSHATGLPSFATDANGDVSVINDFFGDYHKFGIFRGLNAIVGGPDGLIVNWPWSKSYGQQWFIEDTGHTIKVRHKNAEDSSLVNGWSDWKTIAFTDSDITGNAATATALKTVVNLWGNSFDGTQSLSNSLILDNNKQLRIKDTAGTACSIISLNSINNLLIGEGLTSDSRTYNLFLDGNNIYFRTGAKQTAMSITANGRFLLGSSQIDGGATVNISGRIHVNGATANIALGANPSAGISTGEANGYGTTIWASGNGQGNIQTMRYDGNATTYVLNLNPLGGAVNVGEGGLNVNSNIVSTGSLSLGTETVAGAIYLRRNTHNYLWASSVGGSISIGVQSIGGAGVANASLQILPYSLNPGTRNNAVSLGVANYRWSDVYSVNGDFNGRVIIGGVTDDETSALQVKGAINSYSAANDLKLYTRINGSSVQVGRTSSSYTGGYICGLQLGEDNTSIGYIAGCYDDKGANQTFFFYGGKDVSSAPFVISIHGNTTYLRSSRTIISSSLEVNGTTDFNVLTKFNSGIKIGEATLSYENGALKVDKNFFAEGEVASGKVAEEGTGGNTPSGSGLEIKTFDIASTSENQMVELAHNLGTRDVVVQIFENSQSSNYQQVFADVYYVDTAKVAINFGAAQTVPHRVIIMG